MESIRQPVVDLIYRVINATPPVFVDADEDPGLARLANQLIDGGYLAGEAALGNQGTPLQVAILDVTIEGRRLCEQLEDEIRQSKLSVKTMNTIKKGTLLLFGGICGIIGGVVGAVITALVLRYMGL